MSVIADHCRYAKRTTERHGWGFEILDGGEGYLFRVSSAGRSCTFGAGPLASFPMNSAFGASVARDKVFTNRMLELARVPHFGGRAFFLTPDSRLLRGEGYELADAEAYLLELGGTAFCKPLTGSRGDFAEIVVGADAFREYASRCAAKHRAIVMQRLYSGRELRVFVMDGSAVYAVTKAEAAVTGDGIRSVGALLEEVNLRLTGTGVSRYSENARTTTEPGVPVDRSYVPAGGERITIAGRRNLGFSGTPQLLEPLPADAARLAITAVRALGLRLAAVDLMECREESKNELRVIEVNSNPEIVSLERLDRWDLIEHIWSHVIRTCLDEAL